MHFEIPIARIWVLYILLELRESFTLCQTGNLVNEQHLVLEGPALQGIRDRYNGVFGDHAATLVQFMWQHDTCVVAQFIEGCMDAHSDPGPQNDA